MAYKRSEPAAGLLVMLLCCFGLAVMAADWVPLSLRRLQYLGIPYPALLDYIPVLAPAAGLALYFLFRRPLLAGIAGWLLASFAITAVGSWADHRPARVPVIRSFDSYEIPPFEARLGFKVCATGSADGDELQVRPEYASRLTEEAKRLGIFRDGSQRGDIKPRPPTSVPATVGS